MNKKELVEELKQNIPDFTGTEEEKELKTALYVYVELAKRKVFDTRFYGNIKQREKAVRESIANSTNIDESVKKRRITCISMASLYSSMLEEFGINSMVCSDDADYGQITHRNNMIITKSVRRYEVDCQRDMENIQTKRRLQWFAIKKSCWETIPPEKLTEMLIEVGYIENEKDYQDDVIAKLASELKDEDNVAAQMRQILENKEIYEATKNAGVIEARQYYDSVLQTIIPESKLDMEAYEIKSFMCRKKKNKDDYDYTFGIYGIDKVTDDVQVYMYSAKKKRPLHCDIETLKRLKENGLILGRSEKDRAAGWLNKKIAKTTIKKSTDAIQYDNQIDVNELVNSEEENDR